MASPESVVRLLIVASALLDRAAGEIRDAQLQPVRQNVTRIGKALAEIFELEDAIYVSHPHLRPGDLAAPSPHADANRRLMCAMGDAQEHEERGRITEAVATYRDFLQVERTQLHRDIAQGEIERLQRKTND